MEASGNDNIYNDGNIINDVNSILERGFQALFPSGDVILNRIPRLPRDNLMTIGFNNINNIIYPDDQMIPILPPPPPTTVPHAGVGGNTGALSMDYLSENPWHVLDDSFMEPASIYKKVISAKGLKDIQFVSYHKKDYPDVTCCTIMRTDFEEGEEIAVLPCKHIFGKEAILHWLKNKSSSCPVCRARFDYKEVKKEEVADEVDASGVSQPRSLARWIYNRRAAVLPTTRARGRRAALRNMLMDVLDERLRQDEEEQMQRALIESLRTAKDNTGGDDAGGDGGGGGDDVGGGD